MEKILLTERKLLDAIKCAIVKECPHPEHECRVESLKIVNHPNRNWEADQITTMRKSTDLWHMEECEALCERVLERLASEFDVSWPS